LNELPASRVVALRRGVPNRLTQGSSRPNLPLPRPPAAPSRCERRHRNRRICGRTAKIISRAGANASHLRAECPFRVNHLPPDDLRGKAFHFLGLRAALEQQEIDAGGFKFRHAVGYLFRGADEAGAQAAI
jgi:hypothetical protein